MQIVSAKRRSNRYMVPFLLLHTAERLLAQKYLIIIRTSTENHRNFKTNIKFYEFNEHLYYRDKIHVNNITLYQTTSKTKENCHRLINTLS